MKTLIVTLSLIVVLWFCCGKEIKSERENPGALTISTGRIFDSRKFIMPFSWQTKWFKKDLNSGLNFSGKEGC